MGDVCSRTLTTVSESDGIGDAVRLIRAKAVRRLPVLDDDGKLVGTVAWMPAIVLHFINGSITLPLIYVYLVFRLPPGEPWISGALWGLILRCLTEIIVMRLMQDALSIVTSIGATAVLVFGLLLVFLVYGALLGWVAGAESPRPSRLPESQTVAA